MSLVSEYIQEDMIVSNQVKTGSNAQNKDTSSIKTGTNNGLQCEPKSYLMKPPQTAPAPSQLKALGFGRVLPKFPEEPQGNGFVDCNTGKFTASRVVTATVTTDVVAHNHLIPTMEQLRKEGIQRIVIDSKPPLVGLLGREVQTSHISELINTG